MKILSLNIGAPKVCQYKDKMFETSIFKLPISSPLLLTSLGAQGDHISDPKHHGGIDKAIYAYSYEHKKHWEHLLKQEITPGAFGENLTLNFLDENNLFVGDQYAVGDATLEVSEPRIPCFKLDIRFNNENIIKLFNEHSHCGSYFRVIKEGSVKPGDELILIKRESILVSINELFSFVKNSETMTTERATELLKLKTLSQKFINRLEMMIKK